MRTFDTGTGEDRHLRAVIERLRRRPVEYLLKLAFFNVALTVLYLVMRAAVLASLPQALSVIWVLYAVGNVVFLAYDFGFSKLIALYLRRVGPVLRK